MSSSYDATRPLDTGSSLHGLRRTLKSVATMANLATLSWTLLLSYLVWRKTMSSDQLPITDAFEYYAKAKHFWDAISSSNPYLAFDVEPVFRPFGTVLMSYPFGFNEDPRPFYFRSVFLGVIALMIAVFIAGTTAARRAGSVNWTTCVALSASALPMFYHFEASELSPSAPVFWGLVDCFFSGLAAIAAAAVVRAVALKSMGWTLAAITISAYSLLVKPTGVLVMLIIGLAWSTGVAMALLGNQDEVTRKRTLVLLGAGTTAFAVTFGGVLWWCISSRYLSGMNMAYGSNAMSTLQTDWSNTLGWRELRIYLYPSFGIFFPLALIVPPLVLLCSGRLPGRFWRAYGWHLTIATITLITGLWLWLVSSNATQVRYLFPFALAALIFMLPALGSTFSMIGPYTKIVSTASFVIPMMGLTLLLVFPNIPRVWQDRLGVNLDAGPVPAEGVAASRLVQDLRRGQRVGVTVYDLTMGSIAARVLGSRSQYEHLTHAGQASFEMVNATDWIPPSVLRTREVVDADYILTTPLDARSLASALGTEDKDFHSEVVIFSAWGSELAEADGVVTLASGAAFRLYKVVDRDKLQLSLAGFMKGRKWRTAFLEYNPAYWWSREELDSALRQRPAAVQNVGFDKTYRIEAATIRNADGVIVVDVWWSALTEGNASTPDRMYLHLQDGQNKVVRILASWLHARAPLSAARPIRLSSFRFAAMPNESMSVALGIYDGVNKFLLADGGQRDWGNQRIVMQAPPGLPSEGRPR